MSYTLHIQLSGLPETTNSGGRKHWTIKAKEARKWKSLVLMSCMGKLPAEPLKKAKLTLTRHSSMECDFDGLVSSFKSILDGLVYARVIENDKPSVIGSPTYKWEKQKPLHGFVSVLVEGDIV